MASSAPPRTKDSSRGGLTPTSRLAGLAAVADPDAVIEIVVPRYTVTSSPSHGR
jgi:hypothetical protein